ncbi:integrin alpha-9 [Octopus sinensis]|uniref:Integrin alpha-9 n=1 Tax=Octopus sinensis TaxID=2607531 RepID=A0A6P7SN37_9MOLL|nr:integrin alpha-9 [Octopus sinensis]
MKLLDVISFGFFLIINSRIFAFNIDTNFPIIFKGETDSMFGFSLAIAEQDSNIWLYVGAPRGNKLVKINNNFSYQNRAGSILLCNASYAWVDEKQCSEMLFPKEAGVSIHDMTGFSMTVVPKPNTDKPNKILFCAPLWSKKFYHLGKCYEAKIGEITNIAPTIIPQNISVDGRFVYLSAGFSVHSFKNGDVSYGVPGTNNCSGLIFMDKLSTGTQKNVTINSKVTPSYLGFSIYSGKFTKGKTEFLIGGAPKFNDTGRVDIFNKQYSSTWNEIGSQMGSYFGAALCAVDVNHDGCDDLLIGSPMYKAKIAMEGKVNVYISQCTARISFWDPKPLFGSKGRNAQFGNAIADVGDLNNDLYKDVVIGAPFEDDNIGCIYIYNGGKEGLANDTVQRICGGTFKTLLGFGWSISKSVDVDKNGYNDFAVSALISNKVAILRGRPIIEVSVNMDLNNANLSESNIINITLIFLYNTKHSSSNDLVLGYKLEVDTATVRSNKRLRLSDSVGSDTEIEEKITLKRNESVSKTFTAVLKSNIADFLTPLKFNLSYCIHSHKNLRTNFDQFSIEKKMS